MVFRRLWNAFLSILPPPDYEGDKLEEVVLNKFEDMLRFVRDDNELRPELLSYYATIKLREFQRKGRRGDLEEALCKQLQALEGPTEGHPNLGAMLSNLGEILEARFERTKRMEDLEEALRRAREALSVTPKDHPELASRLNNLGNKCKKRFDETRRKEDLDEAFRRTRKAINITPEDNPSQAIYLNNLGTIFNRRFKETRRMEDLEEAIRRTQQALNITPENHTHLGAVMHNLGIMLDERFARTGRIEDLEEATRKAQQAVEVTPEDHPELASRLNSLGSKFAKRFERTGKIEDVEKAIRRIQRAISLTPKDHLDLAMYLCNIGVLLGSRFTVTERMWDLEEGIRNVQQAVNLTPEDHPDLAGRLNTLGNQFEKQFQRTGEIADLEEAIRRTQQAIDVTPQDHPDMTTYLDDMSNKLETRFEKTRKIEDLEAAIRIARQVIDITPEGHPHLGYVLSNLGDKLERRFKRRAKIEDLEEAIRRARQAVDITPEDHSQLAGRLTGLGSKLSRHSQLSYHAQALECFLKAWNCLNGRPFHRVAAAHQAIRLLLQRASWSEALVIAKQAIQLLPLINDRSLSRQDQQHVVSQFSGLPADACSLSLQAGDDLFEALELLELGRGVIMGLLIDDRSDISKLKCSEPEKAATYDRLRNEVNAPINEIEDSDLRQRRTTRHLQAVKDLDECIRDIRLLGEHQRFLLGPTAEDLKEWASEGPIVVVNINDIRSDAIIVTSSAVKSIRLPELTKRDAINWIREDLIIYNSRPERGSKTKRYAQFLLWLWSKCVKIILQEIGDGRTPTSNNLSRIWWIGVGIANSFPFHAAGDHSVGSTENTFHWAISSYTPTIKALAHARGRISTTARFHDDESKLLIVAMPKTPGKEDLRGVEKEVSDIQKAVESTFSYQSLVQPSAKMVLDQLRQYDVVHFACHGIPDLIDSFNSCLLLQEDSRESVDKLTVRQISDANLERAGIAYLSACSTVENRVEELMDEVIHLASGFQVAGFGHVIASMGSLDDEICVKMARGFYGRLKDDYVVRRSNRAIAVALHDSILEIRSKSRNCPIIWAPYVHLGA